MTSFAVRATSNSGYTSASAASSIELLRFRLRFPLPLMSDGIGIGMTEWQLRIEVLRLAYLAGTQSRVSVRSVRLT
jgi:hypothetical protein